jgi:hypothetical protein
MKYLNKIMVLLVFTFAFISCDKNENFEILPAQESFQIVTPSNGTVIVLNDTNLDNVGLFISWETLSDASGMYDIEVAETGTDFEVPYLLGTTEEKNFSMTVGQLNDFLLDVMGITPEQAVSLDVHVLNNGEMTQTISVVLTPYKVEYTDLYIVGNITDPQWSPADALAMTNVGFNEFEITLDLADGAEFKFLPTNTGWDGDLGEDPDNAGMLIEEGEINIAGYAAGKYDIYVNLNTFTFTVEEVTVPDNLYLVGDYNGWNNATALELYNNGDGIFSIVETFEAGQGFKFLEALGSWDGDWGESKTEAGMLEQDDEQNLTVANAGTYVVVLNFNDLSIKVAQIDNLYMVGDHNGWNNGTAPQLASPSKGVFSIVQNFSAGNGFKFLPTLGSWDGDWGESKTVAGMLVQDDEQNLTVGADGTYVVAVNFNTLSFTVSSVSAIPTTLFLVGDHNGWNNGSAGAFTEVSTGVFEITQALSAGNNFKFLPTLGSWSGDWGESKTSKGVLEQNDEQNASISADGTYKITVNFNNGTITVVPST